MADSAPHPREDLQELLDERLADARRPALEAHLATCELCRRELAELRTARSALRGLPPEPRAPELESRVRARLDLEDRRAVRRRRVWPFASAAAAAAAVALWFIAGLPGGDSLPAAALRDFRAARDGRLALVHPEAEPAELGRRLSVELGFRIRVLDLAMMGWQLAGGAVTDLGDRSSGVVVYRNSEGRLVVCIMFRGRVAGLPAGAERFEHAGIEFFVYRDRDVAAVFWAEGDVLCVLVGDLPADQVRALAVAKAMRP